MGGGVAHGPVTEFDRANGKSRSLVRATPPEAATPPSGDAFPTALRAAIQASGLSLDRIQYRLRARGVSISVTALSYWQSGRRRPERAESLIALGHLEAVLGVPTGSLTALLGPPRPRGRAHRESSRVPLDSLWEKGDVVGMLLEQIDVTSDSALTRISQHDKLSICADRGEICTQVRQVMRADGDGVDRYVMVFDPDHADRPFAELSAIQGCRVGRVAKDDETKLMVAELLFDHALRRGETVIMEYALHHPGPPYFRGADYHCRKFTTPVRECVVELRFDPRALPVYLEQHTIDTDDVVTNRKRVTIAENGYAHAVLLDFGPGQFGMRWEWPD